MYIVFPTFECAPFINGGIGYYISQVIQSLQESSYTPMLLLYNMSQGTVTKITEYYKLLNLRCEIHYVNQLSQTRLESEDIYNIEKTSLALAEALTTLITENSSIVGVEWCEYGGMGYYTLRDRKCNPNSLFKSVPMWVHLHGAREICDLIDRYPVSLDMGNGYVLSNYAERLSLELSDAWKSPSPSVAKWYTNYFGIQNQVVISPLPYRKLTDQGSHKIDTNYSHTLKILCPGRIVHLKGTDIITRACVEICKNFPGSISVTFAGYNLPTANSKYSSSLEEVKSFIPKEHLSSFSFTGKYSPEEYLKLARDSHLAIFASRAETFCLAVHEINWIGVPMILADIPAFKDHFQDSVNCYKFNQSVEELTKVLENIINNRDLLSKIQSQHIPEFSSDIFDELVNIPITLKVNSNYALFTRLQELQLTHESNSHGLMDFKYLSTQNIKTLFTAIAWRIIRRIAANLSVKPEYRLKLKNAVRIITKNKI